MNKSSTITGKIATNSETAQKPVKGRYSIPWNKTQVFSARDAISKENKLTSRMMKMNII